MSPSEMAEGSIPLSPSSSSSSGEASEDELRRNEIQNILYENNITLEEIAGLFLVPCRGSMPSIKSMNIESEYLKSEDLTPFILHPVASSEKAALKYINMNK